MRHSEYISTARRLIHDYSTRTNRFHLTSDEKLMLLAVKTKWSHAQRTKIIQELEGNALFTNSVEHRTAPTLSFAEILKK